MPKVKVLSRNEEQFTRERKSDTLKVYRNVDPSLHPFEKAREYTRALNATKWDKVFAKPFQGALDGHKDGIFSFSTVPTSLVNVFSGACDGELKYWSLTSRKNIWSVQAHSRFVRGICCDADGEHVFTCSDDKTVKIWKVDQEETLEEEEAIKPVVSLLGEHSFSAITHHRKSATFATASTAVDLWDPSRSEPVHSFEWGAESVTTTAFSPVEVNVLASSASDRNIVLYDVRLKSPLKKIIMTMATNCISWNPMEAFNFTTANEDGNCYTFDVRKLDRALNIHEDHVSAVMSVDYSPTGKEFVSGSYDKTIRIFGADAGHSRETYHAKRMQRVFAVKYSADHRYVMSGSDDTNIRLWKARAAERLAPALAREQTKQNYYNKLKQKFAHAPEIRRIARHQHLPKQIKSMQKAKHVQKQSKAVKDKRRRAHSKKKDPPKPAKKRKVIKTYE